MRFQDPQFLFLLLLLIPHGILLSRHTDSGPAFCTCDSERYQILPLTLRVRMAYFLPWMSLPILALLICALARPQKIVREMTKSSTSVDVMIALDVSTSMLAEDPQQSGIRTSRMTAAKKALNDFLDRRNDDRIGLIAFAARPYPAAPLTQDHLWLKNAVERLQAGTVEDGSAVGDGLLAALNRLRTSPAGHSAIILLTDGRNNTGTAPLQAAEAAAALGVRVHTIGVGSSGAALFPIADPLGGTRYQKIRADLDEPTLRSIASITGGRYFRADDNSSLKQVFSEIDSLERHPVIQKIYNSYLELFPFFALPALLLFAFCQLAARTVLQRNP